VIINAESGWICKQNITLHDLICFPGVTEEDDEHFEVRGSWTPKLSICSWRCRRLLRRSGGAGDEHNTQRLANTDLLSLDSLSIAYCSFETYRMYVVSSL
jgi:hypothetical protein